jgi:FMN phosphatase YigB (HAD superfamily)
MDPTPLSPAPRAVALDVFGTIAFIGEPRRPYRKLMALGAARAPEAAAALLPRLMREPLSLEAAAAALGGCVRPGELESLREDLAAELASVELFSDVEPFLRAARAARTPVALCSNLAEPYEAPVLARLAAIGFGQTPIASSFRVGATKPEPLIYEAALARLGASASESFFCGDTPLADRDGPRALGWRSALLDRSGLGSDPAALQGLGQLAAALWAPGARLAPRR